MALDSYSALKTTILRWLRKVDDTYTAADVPDFITLLEEDANRDFRVRQMETTVTLTIGAATVALPADFQVARAVILQTDPKVVFTPKTVVQLYSEIGGAVTGRPRGFAPLGNSLRFAPAPDVAYTAELVYLQSITPLSDDNPTNWLLEDYPSIYLYGSLLKVAPYLRNDGRIPVWRNEYQIAKSAIETSDEDARWSGGNLVIGNDPRMVV